MNKLEYIAKQLSRTKKKKYELYVITRIIHRLDRDDLEIITQQYISRKAPQRHALVDLYLPQLKIYIEVDEPFHVQQVQKDISREADIIDSTGLAAFHVTITDDLNHVNGQIEVLCDMIKEKISTLEAKSVWESWNLEKKFTPEYHINKEILSVVEGSSFRKIVDACNALGQGYIGAQQSWYSLKKYPNYNAWFPKFYENEKWDNSISDDRKTIIMICKDHTQRESYYLKNVNSPQRYVIAFPRVIDSLGSRLYKFAGVFEFDKEVSSPEKGIVFRQVEDHFSLK